MLFSSRKHQRRSCRKRSAANLFRQDTLYRVSLLASTATASALVRTSALDGWRMRSRRSFAPRSRRSRRLRSHLFQLPGSQHTVPSKPCAPAQALTVLRAAWHAASVAFGIEAGVSFLSCRCVVVGDAVRKAELLTAINRRLRESRTW